MNSSGLAALTPSHPLEVRFRRMKSSQRIVGSWLMSLRRPSRTPESSRIYVKGDPVNLIDWKAYARTDQLIIREQRDEASARIVIGVEASTTMAWPTQDVIAAIVRKGLTLPPPKIEVALRVALNLAWIHLRQGDLVEIWIKTDSKSAKVGSAPANELRSWFNRRIKLRSPSDAITLFSRVVDLPDENQAAKGHAIVEALIDASVEDACAREKADVCYLLGDALGELEYSRFYSIGRFFAFCHVLSSLEADISWIQNQTSYFDESAVLKEHQGESLLWKDSYSSGLEKWILKTQKAVGNVNGHYLLVNEKSSIDFLHSFLASLELSGNAAGGSGVSGFKSRNGPSTPATDRIPTGGAK